MRWGAAGSGASGSSTRRARLRVPGGAPSMASGGATPGPSQVWTRGTTPPCANAVDVILNMGLIVWAPRRVAKVWRFDVLPLLTQGPLLCAEPLGRKVMATESRGATVE